MRAILFPIAVVALFCACSRTQQPIVDSIKPAQQTMEAAKGIEQTLQQHKEDQDKKVTADQK